MTYREEIIGDCRLIMGDALEVMPTLTPVDLICTDAPYMVSKGGLATVTGEAQRFGGWAKEYGNGGDIVQCDLDWSDWMGLAFDCLKSERQAYFMTNGRNVKNAQQAAEDAGFDLHTLCVWDKRSALPNRWYQNVTEFTLFMKKGKAFMINDPSSKNLISHFQKDDSEHPTEKPVSLMEQYISNSTKPGWVVLDPFMGSGTTLVASANLGLPAIGIELTQKWFDVACRRVEAAYNSPKLFSSALDPKPIQDAMI